MIHLPELITRCQKGDLRAFAALFDHYQDRLFDLACAILGDREGAKDAVQDTFLTLFQKIDGFRGEAAFDTWLTAILINRCRQKLRYRNWEVAALGLRQAAVLLANPRDLRAQINGPYRGQLNLPVVPAGMIVRDFNDWYTEGPQSFDRYLLGQNPPFDFETALETAIHFPLRFRLTLSEE